MYATCALTVRAAPEMAGLKKATISDADGACGGESIAVAVELHRSVATEEFGIERTEMDELTVVVEECRTGGA